LKKKSGQNVDFNPIKCAPKVKRANITAHANNTAPMVDKDHYRYILTERYSTVLHNNLSGKFRFEGYILNKIKLSM